MMKWNSFKTQAAIAASAMLSTAAMASPDLGQAQQQATNWHAIIMFVIFVGATLFITKWAAKQTTNTKDFYTAGGGISGFQNGLAIAGDYMPELCRYLDCTNGRCGTVNQSIIRFEL